MSLLETENLTVKYGAIAAARDVSIEVRTGEVVGLIGPNGAGKTTTLGAISGLLKPAQGTVRFNGQVTTGWAPDKLLRHGLALVPEHRRLFTDLTVLENLKIGGVTAKASEREERIQNAFELFGVLKTKARTPAGYLSGGEAQQLAIARALMSDARLVLMDEPSLGLAPALVDVVFDLIESLAAAGRTLLVVEQNATRMLRAADRAYVMRSGEIAASGTGAELLNRPDLFEEFVGRS